MHFPLEDWHYVVVVGVGVGVVLVGLCIWWYRRSAWRTAIRQQRERARQDEAFRSALCALLESCLQQPPDSSRRERWSVCLAQRTILVCRAWHALTGEDLSSPTCRGK